MSEVSLPQHSKEVIARLIKTQTHLADINAELSTLITFVEVGSDIHDRVDVLGSDINTLGAMVESIHLKVCQHTV